MNFSLAPISKFVRGVKNKVKNSLNSKPIYYKSNGSKPKSKVKPSSGMKQYGDKGYKPSSGKGVGY